MLNVFIVHGQKIIDTVTHGKNLDTTVYISPRANTSWKGMDQPFLFSAIGK